MGPGRRSIFGFFWDGSGGGAFWSDEVFVDGVGIEYRRTKQGVEWTRTNLRCCKALLPTWCNIWELNEIHASKTKQLVTDAVTSHG